MQNSRKLIKASAATAALAAVGVAGLATAPAASAAPKVVSKSFTSKTPKISVVTDKTVAKGKKVTIKAAGRTTAKGLKIVSVKIGVKKTGNKYGWAVKNANSYKVGAGRWTVRTEVRYVDAKTKKVKKVHLTNRFTVKTKASPAAKISASRAGMWNRVAKCESGGNWKISTGNGYYGGLQFSASTWRAYGGGKYGSTANRATKAQQITIAEKVLKGQGAGAWGSCGRKAGLKRA
jgi:hypothetical protein